MPLQLADVTEHLTPQERATDALAPAKAQALAASIHEHGFALLTGDVFPADALDAVHPRLQFDAVERFGGQLPVNRSAFAEDVRGHANVSLPRTAPFVRKEIVANPVVEQVVAATLGPGAYLNLVGGNMNYPGSGEQVLHMDGTWQFANEGDAAAAGSAWPCPCHLLVVQVVFFDTSEQNGATEIWPSTHMLPELGSCNKFEEPEETQARFIAMSEKRRQHHPPMRLCIPKCGVGFRDARLAHRGVP